MWLRGGGVKTKENKKQWLRWLTPRQSPAANDEGMITKIYQFFLFTNSRSYQSEVMGC